MDRNAVSHGLRHIQSGFENINWTTGKEALGRMRSGTRVFIGSGCAAPQKLLSALAERGANLFDVEIIHILTFGQAEYARRELLDHIRHNAFFIGPNVRDAVNEGVADYTPILVAAKLSQLAPTLTSRFTNSTQLGPLP